MRPARERKRLRRVLVVATVSSQGDASGPAGQIVGHDLDGQPSGVGGEAARGEMVQPDAVLQVPDGVLDLGVAAVVSLEVQRVARSICDEGVIAVAGEEGQLGTGRGLHPPDDEPHRRGAGLTLEWGVFSLGHVGGALHPVGYGPPVRLGYGLYQISQAPAQADGDGEADIRLAADLDHAVGIETAVGPHRELSLGPGVAHPAHRLPQEVVSAPGGIGPALPETGHQHLSGAGGHSEERVIAPLAGVAVMAGSLLAQAVGLADGGVQVNAQGCIAGSGPGLPGLGQQLPADPVQLPDVSPAEAAQEGAQGGRGLDHTPQDPGGTATAQRISVVDAVAAGQGRGHQGHQLVAGVGPARGIPQVKVFVHQFTQTQTDGQGGGQQQPSIGHQAVVVEGDVDAVGVLRW